MFEGKRNGSWEFNVYVSVKSEMSTSEEIVGISGAVNSLPLLVRASDALRNLAVAKSPLSELNKVISSCSLKRV